MKKTIGFITWLLMAGSVFAISYTNLPYMGSWPDARGRIDDSMNSITSQLGSVSSTGADSWAVAGSLTAGTLTSGTSRINGNLMVSNSISAVSGAISGNLAVGGAITGATVTVTGDTALGNSNDDVTTVAGDMVVTGRVTATHITSDTIATTGNVDIDSDLDVNNITIDTDGTITGVGVTITIADVTATNNLTAGGDLSVGDDADIAGNIRATNETSYLESVYVEENANIIGSVTAATVTATGAITANGGAVISGASGTQAMADEEIQLFTIPASTMSLFTVVELTITNDAAGEWTNIVFEAPGTANVGKFVTVYTAATNKMTVVDNANLDSAGGNIVIDGANEGITVVGEDTTKWLVVHDNTP